MLEHPDITSAERTGYPSWMNPKDDDYDQDAYEAYCDAVFEEDRDRRMFGD